VCDDDREILELFEIDPDAGMAAAIKAFGDRLLGRLHVYARDHEYGNLWVEDVFLDCLLKLLEPDERKAIIEAGGCMLPWLTRFGYWQLDKRNRHSGGGLDDDEAASNMDPAAADPTPSTILNPPDYKKEESDLPPEALQALQRAWVRLSCRDRRLLWLRYFDGQTEAAIAELCGLPASAVKKGLHDARRRLAEFMKDEGFDVEE
jgi:DNA-directed RNA polymerase specialized sigma24 family protein